MTKTLCGVVAAVLGVIVACAVSATILLDGVAAACTTGPAGTPSAAVSAGGQAPVNRFDSEQVSNAATILAVGARMGVPERGWIIAMATALQESGLRNLPGGDRDSIGLFQQRPSQGWGSPQQLHHPVYAATKFYQKLLTIDGWQTMPLTQAAQAVQHSSHPNAYAKQEPAATALVKAPAAPDGRQATATSSEQCLNTCLPANTSGSIPQIRCTSGAAVLARAATWLAAWNGGPVPYRSSADPTTWYQGYRRDCSGYASMALGLPGPGLNTAALAARSTPLQKTDLSAGDLLINPAPNLAGHVVIFDHWTDTTMTSYMGYEQSGDSGTHHRVIPYPYFGGYRMSPYRWGHVVS